MADPRTKCGCSSPDGATWHKNSPGQREKGEGVPAVLTTSRRRPGNNGKWLAMNFDELAWEFPWRIESGWRSYSGRKWEGCRKPLLNFKQGFEFEIQRFKDFQAKFELGSSWNKLNKISGYFSNLDFFKISLNIQIQMKVVNERLLKWFRRRFQNEI
jgi:hypothetical protein